ncbi:Senescence regulator [Senna tora]|uniref:Senescence regulator n=1 Tax=Senna tora TaxID=362788 RepID=A0A835CFU7_9FABA|nr:Senescence regulator [Senna tora]
MAKGRKPPISHRSERLLGSYSYNHHHHSHSSAADAADASELAEDDVWSTVDEIGDRDVNNASLGEWPPRAASESSGGGISIRGRFRISRDDHHRRRHVGGLSLAFEDPVNETATTTTSSQRILHQFHRGHDSVAQPRGHHMATSAPVNVPDWSKILRVDSVESLHEMDDGDCDGDESEMVPPHEYLAREYARGRKMAANSVFEGVGRTLKGRDLRRVRDAVWSQTGFDG